MLLPTSKYKQNKSKLRVRLFAQLNQQGQNTNTSMDREPWDIGKPTPIGKRKKELSEE